MQIVLTALIVFGCSVYAAWLLMPTALRRAIALRMLRLGAATPFAKTFEAALRPAGACGGCDGCGAPAATGAAGEKPITLHRRTPR